MEKNNCFFLFRSRRLRGWILEFIWKVKRFGWIFQLQLWVGNLIINEENIFNKGSEADNFGRVKSGAFWGGDEKIGGIL